MITTEQTLPVRRPPYRLPHAYKELVKTELDDINDIIETTSSEWASPIVMVKKKDGSLRMCVDYRRLNAVSHIDAYPMPRIDDLIDGLGNARFISALDLIVVIGSCLLRRRIDIRQHLPHLMASSSSRCYLLG